MSYTPEQHARRLARRGLLASESVEDRAKRSEIEAAARLQATEKGLAMTSDEWSNGAFGCDDEGLYSTRCDFVIPLHLIADVYNGRVSRHAVQAAMHCDHASLDEIQEAITHAHARARKRQPDWSATRARMVTMRRSWPKMVDVFRAALAGRDYRKLIEDFPTPATVSPQK